MPDPPIIFLGPSLPQSEARGLLPGAVFLPPVRRHSLQPFLDRSPQAIGIIDGEFYQSLSVSTKEILPFLDRGIPVFGASSMGALRAVELRHEGMAGVGRIYEMYRTGEVDNDDEVALTFCPDTLRPLSLPLVNLRVALAAAAQAGYLTEREKARLLSRMRVLYFPDRTLPALFQAAGRILPEPRASAFAAWWRAEAPDAKADDARDLLRRIAENGSTAGC